MCVLAEIWVELDITAWFLGKPECFERRQYIRRSARGCNQQSYEDEICRHVSLTDYCEPDVLVSLAYQTVTSYKREILLSIKDYFTI